MSGYTKLFNSILDSTIWQESNETRLLWITMLAMSDKDGEVQASIPGLAKRAGITIAECQHGLKVLSSPDAYSRTTDHDGRRIEETAGGWVLLNHSKYRNLLSVEERREYNRKKQAEWRAKHPSKSVNDSQLPSITVNHNQQCQHITEAEADTDTDTEADNRKSIVESKDSTLVRKSRERASMSEADMIEFNCFWSAYPKKKGRGEAEKIWSSKKPPLIECLATLEWQRASSDWQKDGGQFIPNPSTWLNQKRWQDQPVEIIRPDAHLAF